MSVCAPSVEVVAVAMSSPYLATRRTSFPTAAAFHLAAGLAGRCPATPLREPPGSTTRGLNLVPVTGSRRRPARLGTCRRCPGAGRARPQA